MPACLLARRFGPAGLSALRACRTDGSFLGGGDGAGSTGQPSEVIDWPSAWLGRATGVSPMRYWVAVGADP
eukprot:COSAG01_NODE_2377_length_7801_cov_4.201117_10_plen_71_part_00